MKPIYIEDFVSLELIDINNLYKEVQSLKWETKRTARHEYFMACSDRQYSYGNNKSANITYASKPFTDTVKKISDKLYSNVCFLNKYDNEKQHLGWHADDFEGMDNNIGIGVVSLGAEREIWWKPKGMKGNIPDENKVLLKHGSLFYMPAGFQDINLHKIPKHSEPCGERISLTFRKFF